MEQHEGRFYSKIISSCLYEVYGKAKLNYDKSVDVVVVVAVVVMWEGTAWDNFSNSEILILVLKTTAFLELKYISSLVTP